MPVTGPTEELRKLYGALEAVADGSQVRQMAISMGAECLALVKRGFERSEDPYGRPWAAVARGGKPLLDTGRMRNAFGVRVVDSRIEIENNVRYAATHQYGAAIQARNSPYLTFRGPGRDGSWHKVKAVVIPARQMLPEGELPALWEYRLRAVAEKVLHELVRH